MAQRNTQQRQIILEELRKLNTHPTAAALYALVRCRLPKISLGTVYRNLEMMQRAGLILKLDFGGGEARFDGTVTSHDHLRCMNCGRVEDVPDLPLALREGNSNDLGGNIPQTAGGVTSLSSREKLCCANDLAGYKILGHRLEYFGLCPDCRAAKNQ
jgi:Fur family transcriptional regulator, ferric uptake regulator